MNYLAHALLSGGNSEILVGNFIADHLRGNDFSSFSPGVIKGIQMHRQIDHFTDTHELFRASKRIFYDGFEKHSGILVDIYFDHLLAKCFEHYSSISLIDFSTSVYKIYADHAHLLPHGSARFLDYVIKNNIYHAYSSADGIESVLYHLSQRIKHNVRLDQSLEVFQSNEQTLQQYFDAFFKEALSSFLPL